MTYIASTPAPGHKPHKPARNRSRMILIGVLAVSLLGNALAAGAALRLRALRDDLIGGADGPVFFARDMRRDLRGALQDDHDRLLPLLQSLAQDRARIVAAGTADPFDPSQTEAAMAAFRADLNRLLDRVQAVVLSELTQRAQDEGRSPLPAPEAAAKATP